ncbi:MAG: hypothetical protein AB4352_06900 [Hormoscilla sp.]
MKALRGLTFPDKFSNNASVKNLQYFTWILIKLADRPVARSG